MPAERRSMAAGRAGDGIGEPAWACWVLVFAALAVIGVMLVMPLIVIFAGALAQGWNVAAAALADPDAQSAIRLTLLVAAIVVPLNTVFGLAAAWCLVHFRFPGRALLVTLIELPFAVSPVVAGLLYVLLFGLQGWFGPFLRDHGVPVIFALPGIVIATIFVTLPLVARQVMPLMQAQGIAEEEAALTLGANGWQIFRLVTLPKIRWALLTGMLLCNARAMGEFGAVSVVSGRITGATMTMPLQIENLYNSYSLPAAFAMASLLSLLACVTIFLRMALEWHGERVVARGARAVSVQR
jgi:sulfate transport system permease protein